MCQMMAYKNIQGLFCVVDPLFETTKNIPVIWVDYDEGYIYYTDKILIYGD